MKTISQFLRTLCNFAFGILGGAVFGIGLGMVATRVAQVPETVVLQMISMLAAFGGIFLALANFSKERGFQ